MTVFLGGKPATNAADAEGVGYPSCSIVLRKLGLWVTAVTEMLCLKGTQKVQCLHMFHY